MMIDEEWGGKLKLAANMSMLYAHLPVHERPSAAAHDGFRYVESWWPFDESVPPEHELASFCDRLREADVELVLLNLDGGDASKGDRGLLSHPRFGDHLDGHIQSVCTVLARTGCRIVNALFGNRVDGIRWSAQESAGLRRLTQVADSVAGSQATVVIETLNATDSPNFPFTDIADTARFVRLAREHSAAGNVGLLVDTYHLAVQGVDPAAALQTHSSMVKHVQFADHPGRGRPGTGLLDFAEIAGTLADTGYEGFVGLEFVRR